MTLTVIFRFFAIICVLCFMDHFDISLANALFCLVKFGLHFLVCFHLG